MAGMNRLVALVMAGGASFVTELQRAWDDGDAVLPVDLRLPPAVQRALIDEMAPSVVIDEHGDRVARDGRPVEPGDALVMATSGTTGTPKGVVLTHAAIEASSAASSARLGVDPQRHRWLACLPVAHIGGLSVVLRGLHTGTPLVVHPAFDAGAVQAAAAAGVTHTSLVPTALARLDPGRFERILVGGAAPPERLAPNCVVTYGMTETASGIWYDDRPLDGVEVRVDAGPDGTGEIWVRAPMLLRCYRDGTDPLDRDGWFPTGDSGTFEPDGRLVVHGRRGDMIVTGGENVWPAAVEAVLASHPGVADVLVVGRADPEWGQLVTAVVVPATPESPPVIDELREFARAALAPYALPRRLELVPTLARTAVGKLRREVAPTLPSGQQDSTERAPGRHRD
jgi:O-succinylbenzoic acid--CoA ligase